MVDSYQHIYLSPHYDDASLSCGGAIHRHSQAGQPVLVVTVCAAPPTPSEPLSAFAQILHQQWGNPGDVVALRQAEDQSSLAILGADYLRLNFSDCIYRGEAQHNEWFYNSVEDLFGPIHPGDQSLVAKIVDAVVELVPLEVGSTLYAPLAVGHHVDHQVVNTAAWQLRGQGWRVLFYEDYPYTDPDSLYAAQGRTAYTLENTLTIPQNAALQPQLHFLAEDNLQAKIKSVAAYGSQLESLFGGATEMTKQLRRYALRIGEGRLAERVWVER
jgi:LmbE family N-acetylglucosaminyl deacetylase